MQAINTINIQGYNDRYKQSRSRLDDSIDEGFHEAKN